MKISHVEWYMCGLRTFWQLVELRNEADDLVLTGGRGAMDIRLVMQNTFLLFI